ncbi:MAG: SDR family oxidoreductase [Candidatus Obscuribacterales bacterium]|nr:SDR family oxidoreductase [Candidatus Obscuribacterales bacterium]
MSKGLEHEFAGIVTGASTGIGRGLAVKLAAEHKARLVINARSQSTLAETAALVEAKGGKCIPVVGDIADPDIRRQMVESCVTSFGGVSLLVNNAGLARPGRISNLTTDIWRQVFEVNFFACLDSIYQVFPHFVKQGHGKIVNISSVAGKIAFPGSVCYSSSKFALTAMSNGMAAEFAGQNIDVLTVCPGWVRTEFFEKNDVIDAKNPTLIAQEKSARGWLMKNILSISTDQAVDQIEKALMNGGSHELIMTAPGKLIERLQGVAPGLVRALNRRIPIEALDSSRR